MWMRIHVLANMVPDAKSQRVEVQENGKVYIQLGYTDPDGGPGPYSVIIVTKPEHGTLSGSGNDRYYEPLDGFKGNDRIIWRVNDGKDLSEPAEIIIKVK